MRELTKAELAALRYLENGQEVWPIELARKVIPNPQARGNFCGAFRRLYTKGAASIRVTRDAVFYRITDAGRAALKGGKDEA